MSSPALAPTPLPLSGGTGAGATTGTAHPAATVITRCVRTPMENRRTGNRGASQAAMGRWRVFSSPSLSISPQARHAAGGGRQ
jgi:hypothetical protein